MEVKLCPRAAGTASNLFNLTLEKPKTVSFLPPQHNSLFKNAIKEIFVSRFQQGNHRRVSSVETISHVIPQWGFHMSPTVRRPALSE